MYVPQTIPHGDQDADMFPAAAMQVEAEKIFEVSEAYEIDSVPTILLLKVLHM